MKRIVRVIVFGLLACVIVVPPVLMSFGVVPYRIFVVKTGSMTPTIPAESVVLVKVGDPKLGEPIAFHKQGGVVTHRWVGINPDKTLQTKGDALSKPDAGSLEKADVIGGVIASAPKLGYWLMYFRNPFTLGGLILLFLSTWLFWPLFTSEFQKPTVQAAT